MPLPVTSGLVLHLETDGGVVSSGGVVQSWADGSSSGNDLTAVGDPTIGAVFTPSGADAIALDGAGDKLERVLGLAGLPSDNQDRTVFFVVDYVDPQGVVSGAVFGDNQLNQTFGLAAATDGDLMVQGYGPANDFPSTTEGVTGGFLVQSVVLEAGVTSHYRDGLLIDSDTHSFNTDLERLVIGEEIGGVGFSELNVAAVLVYDRALTDAERAQTELYLQTKYLDNGVDDPPAAFDDVVSLEYGASAAIDVLANDVDDGGAIDPSTVTVVAPPQHGTVESIDPATGAIQYQHDGSFENDQENERKGRQYGER